jgi:hypothetical protein
MDIRVCSVQTGQELITIGGNSYFAPVLASLRNQEEVFVIAEGITPKLMVAHEGKQFGLFDFGWAELVNDRWVSTNPPPDVVKLESEFLEFIQ